MTEEAIELKVSQSAIPSSRLNDYARTVCKMICKIWPGMGRINLCKNLRSVETFTDHRIVSALMRQFTEDSPMSRLSYRRYDNLLLFPL